MNINELLKRIKTEEEILMIKKAYIFASEKLDNINSHNGKSLMQHVLLIINTLLDFNADSLTIISAMLYETINYGYSKEEIEKEFGHSIATIASDTALINKLECYSPSEYEKYLKGILKETPENVRSLFIKLAERFYIMQTMEKFSEQYQKKLAESTLNVLIPTANRLRLNFIKSKLEDLCLYYLEPQIYTEISEKLNATSEDLKGYLKNMQIAISNLLTENNIDFVLKSRVKNFYSIYKKMCSGKTFEDIYDILAIRILTPKENDCTKIIQLIHSKYKNIPSRYKDYIHNPKENMYQSIHTTIIGEDNRFYEIQIRTNEMNKNAEKGSASHNLYKKKKYENIIDKKNQS